MAYYTNKQLSRRIIDIIIFVKTFFMSYDTLQILSIYFARSWHIIQFFVFYCPIIVIKLKHKNENVTTKAPCQDGIVIEAAKIEGERLRENNETV